MVIGLVGISLIFILLAIGVPVAFSLFAVGFGGYAYVRGFESALFYLGREPFTAFSSYTLSALPLFILMGTLCFYAGISEELYKLVHNWLGRLPGGLAMATVGACAGFAAVSGSSTATAATMGMVALPEMKKYKYDDGLATGSVAAGGTIGVLIPPSIGLIVYGLIAEQSVGRLFLAGFFPGILEAVFYMITIFILSKIIPHYGPPGPRTTWRIKIFSLKNIWPVVALFGMVMGGIYFGVFTPTEASGIGAFGALVFAIARKRLSLQAFTISLFDTAKTTAMIFFIVAGAFIFGHFLVVTRFPDQLTSAIAGMEVNRYIIIAAFVTMYIFLGAFMDGMSMVLITVPILLPTIMALGFNPIWFGIIIVRMTEIGAITPPFGLNVFVIKGIAKDIPLSTIFRGIIPFLIADIFHVALLIAVPQLSLFLPGIMK